MYTVDHLNWSMNSKHHPVQRDGMQLSPQPTWVALEGTSLRGTLLQNSFTNDIGFCNVLNIVSFLV